MGGNGRGESAWIMATLVLCKSPPPRADRRMLRRLRTVIDYCSGLSVLLLPDRLLILRDYLCGGKPGGVGIDFYDVRISLLTFMLWVLKHAVLHVC